MRVWGITGSIDKGEELRVRLLRDTNEKWPINLWLGDKITIYFTNDTQLYLFINSVLTAYYDGYLKKGVLNGPPNADGKAQATV